MKKDLDMITGAVLDEAILLHRGLGSSLLESVYEVVLAGVLERRGLRVERQKRVPLEYDGHRFVEAFRADLLVEERVLVEIKSVELLAPVHAKQVLTYLRLMNLPVGLLVNFGGATVREGFHRIVNGLPASDSQALRINRPTE